MAAGASAMLLLGAAAVAQTGGAAQRPDNPAVQALVLDELARMDWIKKSDVAALREGVIESMELQLGMPVKAGGVIGYLHREIAELTVAKNKLQAEAVAPQEKAKAQKEVAGSVVARNKRLNARQAGMVSDEDVAKAEGELKVAVAQLHEALENQGFASADLNLAMRALKEHTIVAPFDGVVLKRMKNPGEGVRANEAVIQLGDLSRLSAEAYVPLDHALQVREGQIVEIQPRLTGRRGGTLSVEKKRFRGKISFVDPQIQPVAETAVRIRAEFDNPGDLHPGMMVQMTIYLTQDIATRAEESLPTRTARAQ
jgi:RND family efflux transporter MFP subunit